MARTLWRLWISVSGAVDLLVLLVWVAGNNPYFWPVWVWFGLTIPTAFIYAIDRGLDAPKGRRALAVHTGVTCVIAGMMLIIWFLAALKSGNFWPFWPVWPIFAVSAVLIGHAWFRHGSASDRERVLTDRVEVLARTRRGALDVQAAELQRIERDLHDGAQARLVSAAMSLGLAEELLTTDPETLAGLITEARSSTLTALDDLRTLMRGIQPPVLADRGLEGALRALALDLSVPVTVNGDLRGRVPAPVESAAYFAACECLANVVKHSGATQARVDLAHGEGTLSVVVSDDGSGGAAMDAGSGLRGVARRLEVFDGTITLTSPAGGPTVVRMEVPCELSSPRT